jgi:Flp pilus assembly protein TadD
MGRTRHRQKAAKTFLMARPVTILLFCSGLAACSGAGGTQTGAASSQSAGVMNVADAAIAGGDPQMALKVSQSVLANDPKNLDALYHEGAAYYALNRCVDAVAVYKVALSVDPNSSKAQLGIGRCLLRRNAPEAELAFAAAVQDDPNNAAALNDLGIARDLQNNHAGAVQPYQQALLVDPGNISTEVNIGMSLALSGNGEDALQYLGPIATGSEATPKIREDYAAALVAAGRQDEARRVLQVDLPPDQVSELLSDFAAAIAAGQAAAAAPPAHQAAAQPVSQPAAAPPAAAAPPVVTTALTDPAPAQPVDVAAPAVAPAPASLAVPPPAAAPVPANPAVPAANDKVIR